MSLVNSDQSKEATCLRKYWRQWLKVLPIKLPIDINSTKNKTHMYNEHSQNYNYIRKPILSIVRTYALCVIENKIMTFIIKFDYIYMLPLLYIYY